MDILLDYQERNRKLNLWRSSPEHQEFCQQFHAEFERLSQFAANQQFTTFANHRESNTVRQEYASHSDLHRGVYCPSPIYDLIVGNTHRGKRLKRITSRSKPTHVYGFDVQNRLLWCDFLYNGKVTSSEYLVYQDNVIYGITFDWTDSVCLVTEEIYQNSKLIQYSHCLCPSPDGSAQCVELLREDYSYDESGICRCTRHKFCNPSDLPPASGNANLSQHLAPTYDKKEYDFHRKDGYIVSYTCNGIMYEPRIQRSADKFVNNYLI